MLGAGSTSLARLWRDQDRRTAVRNLLAPVYGWFIEGFGTPVLQEAKALLDALARIGRLAAFRTYANMNPSTYMTIPAQAGIHPSHGRRPSPVWS
jgi:hypothetical protein